MQENNKSRKKIGKALTALVMALIVATAFVLGYFFNYVLSPREQKVAREIIKILEDTGYVVDPVTGEQKDITEEDIADALVNAFLDEYSAYYTKEEYAAVTSEGRGNRNGVGISFYSEEPRLTKVVGNSPADRAGMKKGDVLIRGVSDGKSAEFSTASSIISFLSECSDDADITLTVLRGDKTIDFTLKKEVYVASYVRYYDSGIKYCFFSDSAGDKPIEKSDDNEKMAELDEKTAYISLDLFEGDAAGQMESALNFMGERGRTKLILDLRNNGGGYMDVLTKIAAMLIKNDGKGKFLVAYAENKSGGTEFYSEAYAFKEHIEKIVLIANENTASASECLIGALSVYGGAYTAGDIVVEKNSQGIAKTYGKGIMQTTYRLLSGGAFKLTTAKIYWPDKTTSIHGTGVVAEGENAAEREEALSRAIAIAS